MAKVRVYELARELGQDNKKLEEVIRGLGISIKNYMSTLSPEEATRVRSAVGGGGAGATPRTSSATKRAKPKPKNGSPAPPKKKGGTVIRRRGAEVRKRRAERAEAEEAAAQTAARATEAARPAAARQAAAAPSAGATAGAGAATPAARPTPVAARPAARPRVRPGTPVANARPSAEAGPAPSPRAEAPARPNAANAPSRSAQAVAPAQGVDVGDAEQEESIPSPAVGTRIALPTGTRRLPGGMASRMKDRPAGARDSGDAGHDGPEAVEAVEAQGEVPVEAGVPTPVEATDSTDAIDVTAAAAAPVAATDGEAAKPSGTSRRVLRNEDGVIVGAASQRSEPKILGFIPLAQTRKRQQVIITDAADQEKRGRASQRKQREERHQAQGRRKPPRRTGRGGHGGGPSKVSTVEMSEEKKRIRVDEAIQVSDLAHQMGQKASNVLRTLWGMGLRGITINHAIDYETAELVAAEFGYTVEDVAFQEEELLDGTREVAGEGRAPVVTVMGHVDHGKTSLLDYIRRSRVASGEAGGITQHIGAYRVDTAKGPVVFLDTPGHSAFTAMRERGAQITDIVVLVVAADDGVMPTTIEAIEHAKAAKTPTVVALNKIDKPEANPGRVKQALMEQGIVGEEFGGDVPIIEVSAKTGQGTEELLETLAVQAEVLELKAPPSGRAASVVLEARIDKGRGTVATVLVQSGILKKGDIVVANEFHGKVRGLLDQSGKKLKEAGPSTPVEVLGLSGVPLAGDGLNVVESDRDAKALVAHRREKRLRKESVRSGPSIHELLKRKKQAVLKVVLKADVQGSAQALAQALEELTTEKVKCEVLKAEVGQINETDVKYARAGESVIFGFNVKTAGKAAPVAEAEGIPIHTFSVIYDAIDRAKELMVGLLEPEYREREQGEAEVRALFPIPRLGVVAGCRVTRGLIQRSSHIRVVRDGEILHNGTIASLRVFKEDVREVKDGFECGIVVDGFAEIAEGDQIQAYDVEAIAPTL